MSGHHIKWLYWPFAGAIFGALFGAFVAVTTDEISALYAIYMGGTSTPPNDAESLFHLGLACTNRVRCRGGNADAEENLDNAITAFDEALRLSENHVEARCHRGWALVERAALAEPKDRTELYGEALTELDRAIHMQPEYTFAFTCRAHVIVLLKRHDEALVDATRVIELNPSFNSL
jgi:tetratricopeptide (TPR) repeat protein